MAAISRTSILIGLVPPTGMISRSWSARSSFTCVAGRHLPDLVEEEGAAVRHREEAFLVAHGAGEGALHVAEEVRLEQVLGRAPQLMETNGPSAFRLR